MNNVEVEMNQRDIIDALNKCPSHSGLDFMMTLSIETELEKIIESLDINPHTKSTILIILIVISITAISTMIYRKRKTL